MKKLKVLVFIVLFIFWLVVLAIVIGSKLSNT